MRQMRKRVAVLLMCTLPWVAVYRWAASDEVRTEQIELVRSIEGQGPGWVREDMYYDRTNSIRVGIGANREQVAGDVHRNPDRIRIMVLGDSYTAGVGNADLDARWPKQLEDVLNERTREGAFEVVSMATGGASTMTQAVWLEMATRGPLDALRLREGEEARYRPPYDAVVVGYVVNDPVVISEETLLGEQYVKVSREEFDRVITGEIPNPNQELYESAILRIKELAGDAIAVWSPYGHLLDGGGVYDRAMVAARDKFSAAGFIIGDRARGRALNERHRNVELVANPANSHAGPAALYAWAQDVADTLMGALDSERIAQAVAGSAPIKRSDISNYHPVAMTATQTEDGS